MTLGEVLARVGEWLWEFWPLRIVSQWEQGLRVHAGEIVALCHYDDGPIRWFRGVHWFVPIVGDLMVEATNWESQRTVLQTFELADGTVVSVEFVVTWRIHDLGAYYAKIHDHEQTIFGAVAAAAGEVLLAMTWADRAELADRMLTAVKARIRGWGLEVRDVVPAVLTRSPTLRLLGGDRLL